MCICVRRSLRRLSLGIVLASSSFAASFFVPAAAQASPAPLTLDDALRLALATGPDVTVAQQQVAIQRAVLTGAEVFPNNPTASLRGGGRYDAVDGIGLDASTSLSQALPVFGRWGAAEHAAAAGLDVAKADLWTEQTRVASVVTLSFLEAQRSKALLEVADKRIALVTSIVDTAERKLTAGDGTILDVNVWQAELGRAEAGRARLDATYAADRTRLALLCGLAPENAPVPAGRLGDVPLVQTEVGPNGRADLFAQAQRIDAAQSRLHWQERKAWPDVTLSASAGTEGAWWRSGPAGEVVAGVGLSVPLSFFQRNQGAIAQAKATTKVAEASLKRADLAARAETAAASARLAALERAEQVLKVRVLDNQEANLALIRKAHRAGTLGVTDILLRQRSLLDAETAYVHTLADVATARLRLAFATGALSTQVTVLLKSTKSAGRPQ